jgi:hypothetical protein
MVQKMHRVFDPDVGDYVAITGADSLDVTMAGIKYATIQEAMTAAVADSIIIVGPGTYAEDVTWSDYSGVQLVAQVPGTVTIEAVAANAISIDPAAASGTWSATIKGIKLSHDDGLVGLQVDNASVGKRINLYLDDMGIESETSTDHAIDVNRSGAATDAIRIYANGHNTTIEGLVHVIFECADDRVRFNGYRLVGGITQTGAIADAEVTLINCGILTSGRTFDAAVTHNLIGCWAETDANPNVYTAIADEVAQTATS